MNKDIINEKTLSQLTTSEVKKLTPYLDDIEPKLTPKQRKFCYFYIMNGLNGAGASRLAGYTPRKNKNPELMLAITASKNIKKANIKAGIQRVLDNIVENKSWLEKELYEMLVIQATYDPAMFYTPTGDLKFKDWKQIPEKYRCCIESMEVKYHGKDAIKKTISLKLIDRKWAMDKLTKYIEMLNEKLDLNVSGVSEEARRNLEAIFNSEGGKNE